MLPLSWPVDAPLNPLDSAFAQTPSLTPLSSAFTKTPGGMPLVVPSDLWQRSASHVFLLPNFQAFQRSTCKRNSCFQPLPHSFFLLPPSRTHFQQLTHSLHREIALNPSAFNRFRTLLQNIRGGYPPQSFGLAAEVGRYGGYAAVWLPTLDSCFVLSVPTWQCLRRLSSRKPFAADRCNSVQYRAKFVLLGAKCFRPVSFLTDVGTCGRCGVPPSFHFRVSNSPCPLCLRSLPAPPPVSFVLLQYSAPIAP